MDKPQPRDTFSELAAAAEERKLRLASQASHVASHTPVASQMASQIRLASPASQKPLASQKPVASQASHDARKVPKCRVGKSAFTVRLPTELLERFDFLCFQRGLDKQDAIASLISAALAGQVPLASQKELASQPGWQAKPTWQAFPLMIDDVVGVSIISHYQKWTGNEPRETDREALEELRKLPLVAAKIGIVLSVLRSKTRVNSLRYCVGAAAETAGAEIADSEAYLRHLEHRAKRAGKGTR